MSGFNTNVHTAAGSRIFISTNLACPTEHTINAFETLTGGYTEIGELVDASEQGGRTYNQVDYSALSRREVIRLKDTYTQADSTVSVGKDFTDAGQVLVKRALEIDDPIAFMVILQNGDILYSAKRVTSAPLTVGASGSIVSFSFTLSQENDRLDLIATGVRTVTISTAGTGYGTDGDFTATQSTSSGDGTGAQFSVTITSGAVTAASVLDTGSGYAASDTITLAIDGNSATTDAVLTVATIVPALGQAN